MNHPCPWWLNLKSKTPCILRTLPVHGVLSWITALFMWTVACLLGSRSLAWSTPQKKVSTFSYKFGVHPRKRKRYKLLGMSYYNKNPGTQKVLKCRTPILEDEQCNPEPLICPLQDPDSEFWGQSNSPPWEPSSLGPGI